MTDKEECSQCEFFRKDHDPDADGWGTCHRSAPLPLVLKSKETEPVTQTVWPGVHEHDWCGEFEPVERMRVPVVAQTPVPEAHREFAPPEPEGGGEWPRANGPASPRR